MDAITYRCPVSFYRSEDEPLPADSVLTYTLPGGIIMIRHKGTYLEVQTGVGGTPLRIEVPRVDEAHISL